MRPLASVLLLLVGGCAGERATPEACGAILDRIVEIELRERGFRDPVLAERKRLEMRRVLGRELRKCAGRRLPRGALDCLGVATSSEEISHHCLR